MEFLVMLLVSIVTAFVAHEGAKFANKKVRKLDLSPNWFAVIAFLLGLPGLVVLVCYALLKYMIEK